MGIINTPVLLVTIYHIIEWVAWSIFCTATLVGADIMVPFTILRVNTCFGFIALIVGMAAGFGGAGGDCPQA